MTTEIRMLSADNVFLDNDVINFSRSAAQDECGLSVISWSVEGHGGDALLRVFKPLYKLFEKKLPEYEIWLLMGTGSWQPDTRITRYRKLWGGLKLRGVEILHGGKFKEVISEGDEGIKFYGAVSLSDLSSASVVDAILSERCSYIACCPKEFDIESVLSIGWTGNVVDDLGLICHVAASNGFILKSVGEFDDVDWGFVYLGPLDIALKIRNDGLHFES